MIGGMTMGDNILRAPRLHSLTSLRFFAAAFVVVHHSLGPDDVPIVDLGFLGVTFFFVLSGFVLMWAGSDKHGAKVFYQNRFASIYPLHLATLLVAIALPFSMTTTNGWTFLQNILLLQAWTPDGAHSFNWVSWSISAEAFFYLLFPLAAGLLRSQSVRILTVVAVSAWVIPTMGGLGLRVLAPGMADFLTYDFPVYRFGEFVVGICLAVLVKRAYVPPKNGARIVVVAAAFGLLLILAGDFLRPVPRGLYSAAFLPVVVLAIWLVVQRELAGRAKALTHPLLVRLGDWSFALYMVHMIVIRLVCAAVGADSPGYLPWWAAVPVLILSVALAALAYTLIEAPLERKLRARGPIRRPSASDLASV